MNFIRKTKNKRFCVCQNNFVSLHIKKRLIMFMSECPTSRVDRFYLTRFSLCSGRPRRASVVQAFPRPFGVIHGSLPRPMPYITVCERLRKLPSSVSLRVFESSIRRLFVVFCFWCIVVSNEIVIIIRSSDRCIEKDRITRAPVWTRGTWLSALKCRRNVQVVHKNWFVSVYWPIE